MSAKSSLFFSAMGKSKPMFQNMKKMAGGGPVEPEIPGEIESGPEEGEPSPEEMVAASDILSVLGQGAEDEAKVTALAKSLKAFFLMVDSQPHTEGPHEGEGPEEMV